MKPLRFQDIPQLPRAHYEVDIFWEYLEEHLARWNASYGLVLDPPFQREHVWTKAQQVAYVEYVLMGGEVARNLTFNCPGWNHRMNPDKIVLVDGKQRLEAVRAFLRGEVLAFGHARSNYSDRPGIEHGFRFRVCTLGTEAEVLRLYLNINAGGTPHSLDEIAKVRAMLVAVE